MKLFVAGLPYDFDDVDLKEMFELYGQIASAKIIMDMNTGKSKGFGFVDMINKIEAQETMKALNNATIKGKQIVVKEAEDKPRNPGMGRSPNFRPNRF